MHQAEASNFFFVCESSFLRKTTVYPTKGHAPHRNRVSSLLRKTTVPYKGACYTQRQREEPRPRVTEGGRGAGEGDFFALR